MLHRAKYHVLLALVGGALAGWFVPSVGSKPASAADADKPPAANRAAPAGADADPAAARAGGKKPNILVIFGDDVGCGTSAPTTAA